MSEHAMLGENELRQVGDYVRQNLRGWMDAVSPDRMAISTQLLERMVRVEEELKAQRGLMEVKFDAVDRRFEAVDRRFEAVDKRFALLQRVMGVGFVMIGTLVTVFGVLA